MISKKILLYTFFLNIIVFQISYGTLDPSFGSSGITTSSVARNDMLYSSMIQTDSRVVVTGATSTATITRAVVARYTVAGSLDTSFNTTGVQTTLVGSRTEGRALEIQSDGKIIVSGYAIQSQTDLILIRYNTDGSLDTTFNGVGFVTTSAGSGAMVNSVKIKSDGNIVVGGSCIINTAQFVVAQYSSAGTLDVLFGSSGVTTTEIGSNASLAQIALQSDGKIIAAGFALDNNTNKFALTRYNSNGSLDSGFGTAGIVKTTIGTDARIHAMTLQSDGKIVVAGQAIVSGIKQLVVAQYDTNGSLDTTFNATGIVLTNIQDLSGANSLVLQTDGKIVVGGFSLGDDSQQFALARYTTTGTLDATFGTAGIELTTIPTGSTNTTSTVNSLTVSEYILAVGFSNQDFALAAYTI